MTAAFVFLGLFLSMLNIPIDVACLLDQTDDGRVVGQVLSVRDNGKGGVVFSLSRGAKHTRYLALGRDFPEGQLPEPGALVTFTPGDTSGRYPRARRCELVASPEPVQKTDKKAE